MLFDPPVTLFDFLLRPSQELRQGSVGGTPETSPSRQLSSAGRALCYPSPPVLTATNRVLRDCSPRPPASPRLMASSREEPLPSPPVLKLYRYETGIWRYFD